jgi:hypothetical protein
VSRLIVELSLATGIAPAAWAAELENDPRTVATALHVLNARRER